MTQSMSRRGVRRSGSSGPSGHALDLVRSALDVAELLVQHVIRPAMQQANPPDFTKEIGEVAMLLRLADRVLVGEADQGRIAVLAWRISRTARSRATRTAIAARPSRAAAHVLAHGCLHQLGCREDSFDAAGPRGADVVGRERLRARALPAARRRLDPAPAARRRRARPPVARDVADHAGRRPGGDDHRGRLRVQPRPALRHRLRPPPAAAHRRHRLARRASPTRWCSRRSTRTTSTCSGSC